MDTYLEIKNLSDKELEIYVKEKIKELEKISEEENSNYTTIGYKLNLNPNAKKIIESKSISEVEIIIRTIHCGYIKKNTCITYGVQQKGYLFSNAGNYYYLDDDSYILDFCRFIKQIEVLDEYDFFDYVLEFIRNYFGYLETTTREELFNMIIDKNDRFYKPTKEHKLSDFKKNGSAMCSEYATLANNILSFFGFETFYIVGETAATSLSPEKHAFNLVKYTDYQTKEEQNLLMDFMPTKGINIVDIDGTILGVSPYISRIDEINEELINDLYNGTKKLITKEYEYTKVGGNLVLIEYPDVEREYYINQSLGLKQKKYEKK